MGKERLNKKFSTKLQDFRIDHSENFIASGNKTPAEVIPAGECFEGVPSGVLEMIENAIYDFCNYKCTPPIDDLSREKQTRWTACCLYIGNVVFRKYRLIYNENRRGEGAGKIPVDVNKILPFVPVWISYCNKYNKATLSHGFLCFIGLYCDIAGKCAEEVTSKYGVLLKKLHDLEKGGLKDSIVDGSRNPTGAIAILNNEHGYGQNVARIQIETKTAISAENLPVLGIISGDNANIAETVPHFETENAQ